MFVGILLYMILVCGANLFHFNFEMNSDIASDVILAELIWKNKEIMPSTWYIANETRIICTPNIAALFFGITKDMTLASGLACCTMTLMIMISIIYFGKSAQMKKNAVLFLSFLCIALPCSRPILELLYLFASYYAIHVVFLFITLAFYVKVLKTGEIRGLKFLVGVVMALLLGLQGVRGILVIYGPMLGIEVVRRIYLFYSRQKASRSDRLLTLWVSALLITSFVGTCFPFSVEQRFSRNLRKGFFKFFTTVIPDMGRALGWESTNWLGRLCLGILFVLSIYELFYLLWKILKRKFVTPIEWSWFVIFSSPVVSATIVSFTTVESTQRYYFLLPFLLAFSVVLLLEQNVKGWKVLPLAAAILLVFINVFYVYYPIFLSKDPPASEQYDVVCFLEEENCPAAYATFENANMMTVLSNGKIRVYPVATVENMDICKWMASTEWYCPNVPYKQKTAYIITAVEMEEFKKFLAQKGESVYKVKEIGKYTIYISENNYSNLG